MDTRATLLAYSEWLDSQGLMKKPHGKDKRTWLDLANEFIQQWGGSPLAGEEPVTGQAAADMTVPAYVNDAPVKKEVVPDTSDIGSQDHPSGAIPGKRVK